MFVSPSTSRMTNTGHGVERTILRPNVPGTLAGWRRTRSRSARDSWRRRTRRCDRRWPTWERNSAAVRTFWPNTRRDTALCEPRPPPHKPRPPHTSPAPHPQSPAPPGTSACPFKRRQILLKFFTFLFSFLSRYLSLCVYHLWFGVCLSPLKSSSPLNLTSLSFLSFVCSSIYSFINDGSFILEMILHGFSGTFQTRTDKCFPHFSPSCQSIIRSVHPPLPRGSAHFRLLELVSVYIIVF